MGASKSARRLRRLAAVAGMGVALCAGGGVAAADDGAQDAPSTPDRAANAAALGPPRPGREHTARRQAARVPATSPAPVPPRPAASAGMGRRSAEVSLRRVATGPKRSASAPIPPVAAGAPADIGRPPLTAPPAGAAQPPRSAHRLTPATNPVTTATVVGTALTNLIQFGVLLTVSALSAAPPGPFTDTPTLRLNGFDLVPSSPAEVTSVYGRWAYMPGAPGFIQGRQEFSVVDPKTGAPVGNFDALVSRGNGIGYTQLLVTSDGGAAAGPSGGPVPPVGSLISSLRLGPVGFAHSALPTPSGNAVSLKITTPFGDIPVPFPFDNAKGIGDRTVDNRPMRLGNGYSIAPSDPAGETITATSGIMPGFMTVQGHQVFSVYDPNGHAVGSFDGVFTTTSDLFFYTQAVMVTANEGVNVGSLPGQVPPVGSVYNVIYFGADDHFLLYSALPSPDGADVSVIRSNRGSVTASALTLIDATSPPVTALSGAGGVRFVPVSDFRPTGVNGLPPREVEIQGDQQFDVYDSAGARIGTVDADVFNQWDAFGVHSTALLITRVAQGGEDVPPAGSIFNFIRTGRGGFGSAHSSVPRQSGNLTSFTLVTPLGDVPLPSTFVPVGRRPPVMFYSPFV